MPESQNVSALPLAPFEWQCSRCGRVHNSMRETHCPCAWEDEWNDDD